MNKIGLRYVLVFYGLILGFLSLGIGLVLLIELLGPLPVLGTMFLLIIGFASKDVYKFGIEQAKKKGVSMTVGIETKSVLANQLSNLLTILEMFESKFQTSLSVTIVNDEINASTTKDESKYSFDIEDPVLVNIIKDYVLKRAKQLDTNYKLTSF